MVKVFVHRKLDVGTPADRQRLREAIATQTDQIELIDPRDLIENRVQPKGRSKKNLPKLIDNITQTRKITPLIVLRRKGQRTCTILDGHRRREAAIKLDLDVVPCLVVESDANPSIQWMIWNSSARAIKAVDYFYAWGAEKAENRTGLLSEVPEMTRRHILQVEAVFGTDEAAKIATRPEGKRVSPHFVTWIASVERLLVVRHGLPSVAHKRVGQWLLDHKMTATIRFYQKSAELLTKPQARKMRACIEANQKFFAKAPVA